MNGNVKKTQPRMKQHERLNPEAHSLDLEGYKAEFLGPSKFIKDVLAIIAQKLMKQSTTALRKDNPAAANPESTKPKL